MINLFKRKYNTVIMDGSDPEKLREILSIVEMIAGKGSTKCRALDCNHPTMMVLETRTNADTYDSIRYVLNKRYQGSFTFNAKV